MFRVQINKMVSLAQEGDPYARGILLVRNRGYIKKTASRICNRVLRWNVDLELEIALDAFDEAIDFFLKDEEEFFLSYAEKMICLRLYQYYEEEGKLDELAGRTKIESEISLLHKQSSVDRKKRVDRLWEKHKNILEEYGVTREDLLGNPQKNSGRVVQLKVKMNSAREALRKYWEYLKEEIG